MTKSPQSKSHSALVAQLRRSLPHLPVTEEASELHEYGRDWTRFSEPAPCAVAFPRQHEEVQELVAWAAAAGMPLVPSGGRTGLSGGAVASAGELVVSMDKMRRRVDFDPIDRSVTVEAGTITAAVQEFAREQGLYYPVDFASSGSSQIGGNVATNAGGIRVLRYGLTREQVRGLRVVTGSGETLELNRGLIKNATGYDLRHLLIGSEGTLGLISEVTLGLSSPPPPLGVMLLGLAGIASVMPLFDLMRGAGRLTAFEFFTHDCLQPVCAAHDLRPPLDSVCPCYVLLEFEQPDDNAETAMLEAFEQAMEEGHVLDGALAQSEAQAVELWRYREWISESISPRTPYKNDVAVRISQVTDFLEHLDELVQRHYPGFEVLWYGHIGDGNLHMNVLRPEAMSVDEFHHQSEQMTAVVYAAVQQYQGSISAEHGVGTLKKAWLGHSRSEAELALFRAIKAQFDPRGILNPGKLIE
ncbi:MAG: FAD-binding oxidoreductase [Wenzhouxiangellaceae bacterium]